MERCPVCGLGHNIGNPCSGPGATPEREERLVERVDAFQRASATPERTPRPRPTLADAIRTFKDKIRHGEDCHARTVRGREEQCDCAASLNWAILDALAARAEEEAGQRAALEQAVKKIADPETGYRFCSDRLEHAHSVIEEMRGIAAAALRARQGAEYASEMSREHLTADGRVEE